MSCSSRGSVKAEFCALWSQRSFSAGAVLQRWNGVRAAPTGFALRGWNVARGDRSVMRRDDRLTDRKANAHATAAVGIVSRCRAGAIEDDRQLFFRNSGPVITDVKGYRGVIVRDIAVDRLRAFRMHHCVFKQVDDDLLDQNRIHRDHQKLDPESSR